jgi:hypothetical protein
LGILATLATGFVDMTRANLRHDIDSRPSTLLSGFRRPVRQSLQRSCRLGRIYQSKIRGFFAAAILSPPGSRATLLETKQNDMTSDTLRPAHGPSAVASDEAEDS